MRLLHLRAPAFVITIIGVGCGSGGGLPFPSVDNGASGNVGASSSSSGGEMASSSGGMTSTSSSGFVPARDTLRIEPANGTAFIDTSTTPATPGTLAYKVILKTPSGESDVTAMARLTVDNTALGTFTGAAFTTATSLPTSDRAVITRVRASAGGLDTNAELTVVSLRRAGTNRDFYFQAPYMAAPSPSNDVLKFSTNIQQVDVAFVMDSTGSMSGAINNLKNALAGTLVAELQAAIPSVAMAVVDVRDYPVAPFGSPGDFVAALRQPITTVQADVINGLGPVTAGGGNDGPEAQIPAMQHVLTGEALSWPGGMIPAHMPAPGRTGGVDFREGAVPVIVMITDTTYHDEGASPYSFPAPTMTTLKAAFNAANARFVSITSGSELQANDLSDATDSNVPPNSFGMVAGCNMGECCTGVGGVGRPPSAPGGNCRLNFLHSSGNGVSAGVVSAISAISVGSSFDVTARPRNDPSNVGGFDGTRFIQALRAKEEGDSTQSCPPGTAIDTNGDGIKDTFTGVRVGTPVCFEVIPAMNTFVMPTSSTQFFKAFIDVLGVPGEVQLDRREVIFLVPASGGPSR